MKQLSPSRLLKLAAISTAFFAISASAQSSWTDVEAAAKGQTVYFNAWGGGEASNAYIAWAAEVVQKRYGVTLAADSEETRRHFASVRTQGAFVASHRKP